MSSLTNIIDDVTAAAQADAGQCDPEAHASLLQCIQKLTLAAEKPLETAKRLLYQVSIFHHQVVLMRISNLPTTATYQHCHSCSRRVGVVRSRGCYRPRFDHRSRDCRIQERRRAPCRYVGATSMHEDGVSANNTQFVQCASSRPWVSAMSLASANIRPMMSPENSHQEGLGMASSACL